MSSAPKPIAGQEPASVQKRQNATVKSMTGYAQARSESDGWLLRVSVRSVNHRFLDLRLRMPEGFEIFESPVRQLVNERLRRGHVDVTLHADATRQAPAAIHREVAAAYLRAAEDLRKEFGLSTGPDLGTLLRLPGVVAAVGASSAAFDDESRERLSAGIVSCVDQALARLEEMREAEGLALAREMGFLLAEIDARVARLDELTEQSRPAYAARLKTRLDELLGAAQLDPGRLAQEAALLAERADVSEELARLKSHTAQFADMVAAAGEIGKKLDFLLQEMQREANTLLSKTPGLGAEGLAITECGLQIKAAIEKLREQVQNVE